MQAGIDVLTIGNAIVDVIAKVDDAFVQNNGLVKGSMNLIDEARAEALYASMGPAIEISGGSAGNTAAGVASFGGKAAYFGKVKADQLGKIYAHDMRAQGVLFESKPATDGPATARSFILVTPEGERTMNTYLGACQQLTSADIREAEIGAAAVTYMEGYLWDPPEAKKAFVTAAHYAHKHERPTAITLSDPFCVNRYRDEFLDLMRSKTIDFVFANIEEAKALYQTDNLADAVQQIAKDCELAAITMGAQGAMAVHDGEIVTVPAFPVESVVDATGAGDLFAAGFLLAHARGRDLRTALSAGCLAASEVISHIGARPIRDLAQMAREHQIEI